MSNLIKAFQIFLKYGDPNYPTCCEHDKLHISPDIKPSNVSVEDIAELNRLGFIADEDEDCFYSFRYGSG